MEQEVIQEISVKVEMLMVVFQAMEEA